MDLETKFKKETGFDAYADNDLRPKVPRDYYVEWLEEQLTNCRNKLCVQGVSNCNSCGIEINYKGLCEICYCKGNKAYKV